MHRAKQQNAKTKSLILISATTLYLRLINPKSFENVKYFKRQLAANSNRGKEFFSD